MTLIELIEQASDKAKEIISANPTITNVWFEFKDLPVKEIEDRSKKINREYDVVHRDGKDVLRLQCHDPYDYRLTMFAYSRPVTVVKPEFFLEA